MCSFILLFDLIIVSLGKLKINKYFKLKSRPVRGCQSAPNKIFLDQEVQSPKMQIVLQVWAVTSNKPCKYVANGPWCPSAVKLACDKMQKSQSSCLLNTYSGCLLQLTQRCLLHRVVTHWQWLVPCGSERKINWQRHKKEQPFSNDEAGKL